MKKIKKQKEDDFMILSIALEQELLREAKKQTDALIRIAAAMERKAIATDAVSRILEMASI